jgi:hypothetical protein
MTVPVAVAASLVLRGKVDLPAHFCCTIDRQSKEGRNTPPEKITRAAIPAYASIAKCSRLPRMGLIIILVILLLLFGGGGYYMGPGVGYYGGGSLSLILLIVVLYLLFGRGRGRL